MVKMMFYKVVAHEKCDIFFFGDEGCGVQISPQKLSFSQKIQFLMVFDTNYAFLAAWNRSKKIFSFKFLLFMSLAFKRIPIVRTFEGIDF